MVIDPIRFRLGLSFSFFFIESCILKAAFFGWINTRLARFTSLWEEGGWMDKTSCFCLVCTLPQQCYPPWLESFRINITSRWLFHYRCCLHHGNIFFYMYILMFILKFLYFYTHIFYTYFLVFLQFFYIFLKAAATCNIFFHFLKYLCVI